MCSKKLRFWRLSTLVLGLLLFLASTPNTASADGQDTCMNCHDDLYFLHDTGKWYCLRETPMSCTGCHGGDPTAVTKGQAHINRAAHPILNADIDKCLECHPESAPERVQIFRDTAGISPVMVAAVYVPVTAAGAETLDLPAANWDQPSNDIKWQRIIVLCLVTILLVIVIGRTQRKKETTR